MLAAILIAALGFGIWEFGVSRRREDEAWKRIRERGVLTVATDASYPPFAVVDENGDLFGFDIDLAEAIGRRWGVRVEFENIAYDALLDTVISKRDDAVISAFVAQPERAKQVSYTRAYFVSGTALVTRGEQMSEEGAAWARGKTIAVEYGAGGDALARRWARQASGVAVLPKSTSVEALAAVEAGAADAALVDLISAYDFLRGRPGLTLASTPFEPEPYVIAVNVESRELRQALERALGEMEADGSLAALRVKWFGEAGR